MKQMTNSTIKVEGLNGTNDIIVQGLSKRCFFFMSSHLKRFPHQEPAPSLEQ